MSINAKVFLSIIVSLKTDKDYFLIFELAFLVYLRENVCLNKYCLDICDQALSIIFLVSFKIQRLLYPNTFKTRN